MKIANMIVTILIGLLGLYYLIGWTKIPQPTSRRYYAVRVYKVE